MAQQLAEMIVRAAGVAQDPASTQGQRAEAVAFLESLKGARGAANGGGGGGGAFGGGGPADLSAVVGACAALTRADRPLDVQVSAYALLTHAVRHRWDELPEAERAAVGQLAYQHLGDGEFFSSSGVLRFLRDERETPSGNDANAADTEKQKANRARAHARNSAPSIPPAHPPRPAQTHLNKQKTRAKQNQTKRSQPPRRWPVCLGAQEQGGDAGRRRRSQARPRGLRGAGAAARGGRARGTFTGRGVAAGAAVCIGGPDAV